MSEKTKTPREMAEDFVKNRCNEDDDPIFWKGEMQVAFLAGLEAGAKMGFSAGFEIGLTNQAMYFDEWWASLEGEK